MAKEREGGDEKKARIAKNRNTFLRFVPTFLSGVVGAASLTDVNSFQNIDIWEHSLPVPDPDSTRFLILADIHGGNFDENTRQNNSKSFNKLENVIANLKDYPFDCVIQMGDLIREQKSEKQNIANFKRGVDILNTIPAPKIHLVGNHDVWGITPGNIRELSREYGLGGFYGVQKFKNFQIVWLDMVATEGVPGSLLDERIDWLKNNVPTQDTPTIIFSHYPLLPQDPDGNYYFNGNPYLTALTNGQKVWEALKGFPIPAILNSHMHQVTYSQVEGTHMVTVPAFVENMLSNDHNQNPGVYSILEVNFPKKIVLKSYFGSICFSRIQIT